jgi:hypothetical protein
MVGHGALRECPLDPGIESVLVVGARHDPGGKTGVSQGGAGKRGY